MGYLQSKISGLKKRIQCLGYGIFYLRNRDFRIPSVIRVNGKSRNLKIENKTDPGFIYEFTEICLNDCYRLSQIKQVLRGEVKVVVDIGANQGLFCLAARNKFAEAQMFAYEPNGNLEVILKQNLSELGTTLFLEAVTLEDCKVELDFGNTDLHSTTRKSDQGYITGTSFRKVIERAGGTIDLLKMDCEGGEWEIFEDVAPWRHVRAVTMEYHLWAKAEVLLYQ
jgi:FkbM family methyltransferase